MMMMMMRALIEDTLDPSTGMAFVPAVVARLRKLGCKDAHKALLAAYTEGLVELRPESGMGRLSDAELADCIPGWQGCSLSWIRLIGEVV
jgi:hypothetical protein